MAQGPSLAFDQALGVLRQFRGARRLSSRAAEHCELCSIELYPDHPRLRTRYTTTHMHVRPLAQCYSMVSRRAKYKRVLDTFNSSRTS